MTEAETVHAMAEIVRYFERLEDEYCAKPISKSYYETPKHHKLAREFALRVLRAANVNGHGGCLLCGS